MEERGSEKHAKPRKRLRHDELRPDDASKKSHKRLGQPANTNDASRESILRQPRKCAGQETCHRSRHQGDIDDDHEHQIHGHRTADITSQRGLESKRRDDCQDNPGGLHSTLPAAASRAGVGVTTTSTSSRLVKSTAGLIVIFLSPPPLRSIDSTRPMMYPFG